MQAENTELTPEEAKAALGLSTRLSEQYLMSQVPQEEGGEAQQEGTEAPVEPQEGPTEEMAPEPEEEAVEEKNPEIEAMKTDIELLKKLVLKDNKED